MPRFFFFFLGAADPRVAHCARPVDAPHRKSGGTAWPSTRRAVFANREELLIRFGCNVWLTDVTMQAGDSHLPTSPHISPHLPVSPRISRISPYLPISPHISPHLPTSPPQAHAISAPPRGAKRRHGAARGGGGGGGILCGGLLDSDSDAFNVPPPAALVGLAVRKLFPRHGTFSGAGDMGRAAGDVGRSRLFWHLSGPPSPAFSRLLPPSHLLPPATAFDRPPVSGTVVSHHASLFRVLYSDGDEEDVPLAALVKLALAAPQHLVGRRVSKHFPGLGRFEGAVASHSSRDGFLVQYDDGDEEHLAPPQLLRILLPVKGKGRKKACGA